VFRIFGAQSYSKDPIVGSARHRFPAAQLAPPAGLVNTAPAEK
jgi:hypothetical protein